VLQSLAAITTIGQPFPVKYHVQLCGLLHSGHLDIYTVFQKKTSTHIIGYKLRNSCPILIIFDIKIPHII